MGAVPRQAKGRLSGEKPEAFPEPDRLSHGRIEVASAARYTNIGCGQAAIPWDNARIAG